MRAAALQPITLAVIFATVPWRKQLNSDRMDSQSIFFAAIWRTRMGRRGNNHESLSSAVHTAAQAIAW